MSLFVILKFFHVLLAIIAVGFNASYGMWLARVAREPVPTQSFVLKGIKRLDDWFAKVSPAALAVPGAVFVDLDEASNRVRIGVEHPAAQAGVQRAIAAFGVPTGAVILEQTEPILERLAVAQQKRGSVAAEARAR